MNLQKDEMEVEHLATLERLRQSQRQDYLKVSINAMANGHPSICQFDSIETNIFGIRRALYPVQCKPQIVS